VKGKKKKSNTCRKREESCLSGGEHQEQSKGQLRKKEAPSEGKKGAGPRRGSCLLISKGGERPTPEFVACFGRERDFVKGEVGDSAAEKENSTSQRGSAKVCKG